MGAKANKAPPSAAYTIDRKCLPAFEASYAVKISAMPTKALTIIQITSIKSPIKSCGVCSIVAG